MTKNTTDDNFINEVIEAEGPVLVDFWAPWCGPCKQLSPLVDDLSKDMAENLTVYKCNIDENPETPSKYGVRGVPTLMIFKKRKLVDSKVGSLPKSALSYIYLNSILYFPPNSWSVWVNDKKISSEDNKKTAEFYVKAIDNNEVNIIWTISISKWKILSGKKSESSAPKINKNSQVEISFRLKPNQTYILSSGTVVEGRL